MAKSLLSDAFSYLAWATLQALDMRGRLDADQLATVAEGTYGSIIERCGISSAPTPGTSG